MQYMLLVSRHTVLILLMDSSKMLMTIILCSSDNKRFSESSALGNISIKIKDHR